MTWLGRLFGRETAIEMQRRNPAVEDVVRESALAFQGLPLSEFLDESRQRALAREMFLEVNAICNATDPVAACRDRFVSVTLKLASLQVLVIPPPPAEDPTGLRGQPGISGTLCASVEELCQKDDDLRSAMFDEFGGDLPERPDRVVERWYWETRWLWETVNAARVRLGDSVESADWDRAFLHAACVSAEHGYRWLLELPSAFGDDIAKDASMAYAVFTDIVLSGAENPALEWLNYHRGSGIPIPASEAVAGPAG